MVRKFTNFGVRPPPLGMGIQADSPAVFEIGVDYTATSRII